MIDREKLNKVLDAVEALTDPVEATITVTGYGDITINVYPKDFWETGWTEEQRHKNLAAMTPLVGRLEKVVSGTDIGYKGEANGIFIRLNYVDSCKILGYRTEKKIVRKEVPVEVTYEDVEEEVRVPVTDCEIRSGTATMEDIEIPVV
jgi:hypothetical protein